MRAEIAKFLMIAGGIIFAVGLAALFLPKIPWLGRLPGDIDIKGRNFRIYAPIVTCIIISVLLTILLNLFNIFRK